MIAKLSNGAAVDLSLVRLVEIIPERVEFICVNFFSFPRALKIPAAVLVVFNDGSERRLESDEPQNLLDEIVALINK